MNFITSGPPFTFTFPLFIGFCVRCCHSSRFRIEHILCSTTLPTAYRMIEKSYQPIPTGLKSVVVVPHPNGLMDFDFLGNFTVYQEVPTSEVVSSRTYQALSTQHADFSTKTALKFPRATEFPLPSKRDIGASATTARSYVSPSNARRRVHDSLG